MAVTITTGQLQYGGAVVETAGGTKVAIFINLSNNLVAYKDIDGTPAIIGAAQTPTVVHGGGLIRWVDAAIDSNVNTTIINGKIITN